MAFGTQDLTLILKAQDDATAVLKQVQAELARLGGGTSMAGLNAQLTQVNTHLATMSQGHQTATHAAHQHQSALEELSVRGKESLSSLGDKIREVASIAVSVTIGSVVATSLEGLAEQSVEFARSLVEAANASQQFETHMRAFYGSTQAAGQILEWTNQQALKLPFSLDQIRAATASLSEAGLKPQSFLGAAGNIATAYGTTLTDFIDIANRAMATGSLRGLESYLHMTKATLHDAGVEWDAHGKLIASSIWPALEKLGTTRFGSAMSDQAKTAQGGMQLLANQLELFKDQAGESFLRGLTGPLNDLGTLLKTHQFEIRQFAEALGHGLAWAAQQAWAAIQNIWHTLEDLITRMGGTEAMTRRLHTVLGDLGAFLDGFWHTVQDLWRGFEGLVHNLSQFIPALQDTGKASSDTEGKMRTLGEVLAVLLGFWVESTILMPVFNGLMILGKVQMDAYALATVAAKAATEGFNFAVLALQSGETVLKSLQMGLNIAIGDTAYAALASLGPWALMLAAVLAMVVAVKQLIDAYDTLYLHEDPRRQKSVATALTPTGTVGHKATPTVQGYILEGPNAGTYGTIPGTPAVPSTGDRGAFGHSLWQGPASGTGGEAYWAYSMMVDNQDPQYWVAYINAHPDVKKRYLAMMTKEGRGGAALQAINTYTLPAGQGGSSGSATGPTPDAKKTQLAQLGQQFGSVWSEFLAAIHAGDYNTASSDLDELTYIKKQIFAVSGMSGGAAYTAAQAWYTRTSALLPPEDRGPSPLGAGPTDTTGTTDPNAAAQKRLATAEKKFQYDLIYHPQQAMADAKAIQADYQPLIKAGVATMYDAGLEWHADMQSIAGLAKTQGKAMAQDANAAVQAQRDIFQYDLDHKATMKKLMADAQAIYKLDLPILGFYGAQNELHANQQRITGGQVQVGDPQGQLNLALAQGTLTPALLNTLVPLIIQGERNRPDGQRPSDAQISLDTLNAYRQGYGALLAQAKDQFQLDAGNHASAQVLRQDTNAALTVLNAELTRHLLTPLQYKLAVQGLHSDLATALGQGQPITPEPHYQPYGHLGQEPGFGAVDLRFGNPMTNAVMGMVSQLQAMVTYWKSRALHDEKDSQNQARTAANTQATVAALKAHPFPAGAVGPPNTVAGVRRVGGNIPV